MGKLSREKGKRGERMVVGIVRQHGEACSFRADRKALDVIGLYGVHLEVKFTKKLSLWASVEQAKADAREGHFPVVVHRASRRPWVAILPFEDFLALYCAAVPRTVEATISTEKRELNGVSRELVEGSTETSTAARQIWPIDPKR
jgi:hypothetical protein